MKLGVYNAILHDRPLEDAIKVIAGLGLNGIEINSGGFLPPVHIPEIDEIITDPAAAKAYLAHFDGTGVEITGSTATAILFTPTLSSGKNTPRMSAVPFARRPRSGRSEW